MIHIVCLGYLYQEWIGHVPWRVIKGIQNFDKKNLLGNSHFKDRKHEDNFKTAFRGIYCDMN